MTIRKKGYKIIVMVFVMLACTMLVAFKSQDNTTKLIRTNYVSGTHGKTYVIESIDELDKYIKTNMDSYGLHHKDKVYSDTTIGFVDAVEEYDEEYFKEKNLVIVLLTEGSGAIRHKVKNVEVIDGIMEIKIDRQTLEIEI